MKISIVAAVSRNRVIGQNGELPWHLPNDLKRFRELTMGKPVIMGRKTAESLPKPYLGRIVKPAIGSTIQVEFKPHYQPLPGRTVIVMSEQHNYYKPGFVSANSVQHALDIAETCGRYNGEVVIAGGEAIYKAFLPLATHLYITFVDTLVYRDLSLFPECDLNKWRVIQTVNNPADENHKFPYIFQDLELIKT